MKQKTILLTAFLFCLLSLTRAQLKDGDIVKIKNLNAGKYVIPKDVSTMADAHAILMSNRSDAWFTWKVISVPGGFYKFQNMHTNLFLGIRGGSKETYGFVTQKDPGAQVDLQWKLVKTTKGYKIKNKNSNHFIAVEGGSTANNALLIQWTDNGQADIEWQFETVGTGNSTAAGKKILYDVTLNYIAVSEATRDRIDNGDCRRVFGQVSTELWELDENNEMKTRLRSYNNMSELLYNQTNMDSPPTAGLSYHQDNRNASANSQMGKVTYNIPESLLKEKKLMLIVKTFIGTRHKDHDIASYDALRMSEESSSSYILDYRATRTEMIEAITDVAAAGKPMYLANLVLPGAGFSRADDTHKLWVKFSCKRN